MFRNHQQQWIVYAPGAEIHLGLDVEQVDQCENSERDQVSKSPNTLHVSGLFLTPHGVFFELTRTEWAENSCNAQVVGRRGGSQANKARCDDFGRMAAQCLGG